MGKQMAHSFTIILNDDISLILTKIETQALSFGGRIEGTAESGSFGGTSFLGRIAGEYSLISKREIRITIIHKPFIVPYSLIEFEIRKYLT